MKVAFSPEKRTWRPSPLVGQVVLVTTLNEDGTSNVAPKSWISMMVLEPPTLVLGCSLGHWTASNVLRQGEFVVNVPPAELVERVWAAHALPHPRPVESAGFTPIPASTVAPPLVEECRAHLECRLDRHLVFGDEVVLFGEIVAASIDRSVVETEDPYESLHTFLYLEGGTYGVVERSHRVR